MRRSENAWLQSGREVFRCGDEYAIERRSRRRPEPALPKSFSVAFQISRKISFAELRPPAVYLYSRVYHAACASVTNGSFCRDLINHRQNVIIVCKSLHYIDSSIDVGYVTQLTESEPVNTSFQQSSVGLLDCDGRASVKPCNGRLAKHSHEFPIPHALARADNSGSRKLLCPGSRHGHCQA